MAKVRARTWPGVRGWTLANVLVRQWLGVRVRTMTMVRARTMARS